jgi:DNA ligase (NAD+)
MDIDGLGPSYIIQLVEQWLIHSPVDLYNLHQHVDKLLSIDGFGTKRVDKLISELERSKTTNMRRIIHAIGLPGIGKKMAQEIAKAYSTQVHDKQFTTWWSGLQTFLKDETSMIAIYGIGDKLVHDIASYIQQPAYQELLEWLQDVGIQIVPEQPQESIDGYKISGQHFSLTGSFEYWRSQIVKRLESYWAIFDSSPTKSTNIMLIGDKPGSKAAKAQKMDLTIVTSLKQLIEMFPDIKDLT